MLSLLATLLAPVFGFVALAVSLRQIDRHFVASWRRLWSPRGAAALCLGLAGILLPVGGLYRLLRAVQTPVEQVEGLVRLHILLQEPLEQLLIGVQGADPFEDRRLAPSLRLHFRHWTGRGIRSEIPHARLRLVDTTGEDTRYAVSWSAVIEGCVSPEDQAQARRFQRVGDFRGVERTVLEIVSHGLHSGPLPDSLNIGPNDRMVPVLFSGTARRTMPKQLTDKSLPFNVPDVGSAVLSGSPLAAALTMTMRPRSPQARSWVAVCNDDHSTAQRIASLWQRELAPPPDELGQLFNLALAGGILLLVLGAGLLVSTRLHPGRLA